LSRHLSQQGIGPEAMVGICTERSLEMLVGILGILKAGAAYVPLDITYPAERLQFMAANAKIQVLLTQERLLPALPALNTTIVCLDRDWDEVSRQSQTPLQLRIDAQNLAYTMYTYGSTGTPKGAAVTHRNVVRLVRNTDYVELNEREIFLQFAPISFDAATFEIWGALLNGGKLVVFSGGMPSPENLGHELKRNKVTTLWLTAGLFRLVTEQQIEDLTGIPQLLAGGDVLHPSAVARVLEELPSCRLINGYGPTEGTTFSCCYTVLATPTVKNSIPIGTPIANTQVYILDSRMRPVPIGVPGELYIGGDGLARGYWNDPALTAEKFVPDPASADAGARLYKTGDRVRYLADGNIEFLGRIDTQVKLRGYRVEPGEIEAVVKRNAGVQDCVVTVEGAGNDKRLIAYVVRNNNDPELDRIALRTYLHAKLPEYMVPSAFVFLDKLPLTANGKLDRKALPSAGEQAAEQSGEGPRGATEEMLAGIWSSLLGAANLQRENNFFDLGGHSLLTMQLAARLRQIFHCEVPLRAIFEFPVLQDMAAYLDASSSRPRTGKLVRIQPIPRESYLPVTRGQQRIWFVSQLMGNSSVYNIAGAVRLKGEVDRERLERSFQEVVRRHEVLRSSFWVREGKLVQQVHGEEEVGIRLREKELEVRSGEDKEEAERRAVRGEAEQGFDLGQASQLRAGLLRVGERESVLVVVLHHMIADGWSIGVLLRELEQLYEAYGRGEESPLEELEIQYVDYAGWEEELLSSEEMKEGLEYW